MISASLYVAAVDAPTRTTTSTVTFATSGNSSATSTLGNSSPTQCSEVTVNGTGYCSLDVTDNMTFRQFGYSTLNAPVKFMDLTFESTCQLYPQNCPQMSQGSAGVIPLAIIFPDGSIQEMSALYTPSNYQEEYYLSSPRTPRAGFILEGAVTTPVLRVILLVQPWQPPTAAALANSSNNLQLQLYLNTSSSSGIGANLSLWAVVYNPSSTPANVTSADDWVLPLNGTNGGICGDAGPTAGIAIAQGYYTTSNVTSAKLLVLVDPVATFNCPPWYLGYGNPTGFVFQPMSNMGASYGCDGTIPCPTGIASATYSIPTTVTGYYQDDTFTSFPRGTYTVLAEDEWGALALAYFEVPANPSSPPPVATVTVTTTLIIQASQPATSYSIPASCPPTTAPTETVTTSVTNTYGASSTTVTVTTTSTTYAQTVTITTCTYIEPTVTSTITTTTTAYASAQASFRTC